MNDKYKPWNPEDDETHCDDEEPQSINDCIHELTYFIEKTEEDFGGPMTWTNCYSCHTTIIADDRYKEIRDFTIKKKDPYTGEMTERKMYELDTGNKID
jgi:hypothetical protein